jgi:hypothetical protein
MLKLISKPLVIVIFSLLSNNAWAQNSKDSSFARESKPYKILSSGRQITVKSSQGIKNIMLWTSDGNRLVEQRGIDASVYSFTIPVTGKFFFLMVGLSNGKIFTEKIGVQ